MVYIDAVHYETDSHGCEVISQLKWTNTLTEQATNICTKAQMISFINDNPDCTKTKYNSPIWGWREGEDVRVVDNTYLRIILKRTTSAHFPDSNEKANKAQHSLAFFSKVIL